MIAILFLTVMMSACSSTTIYLVRHAEKSAPSGDVPLSGDGLERAQTLADSMRNKLNAVYTTNTKRTQQTAGPSASKYSLTPIVYANGDSLLQNLVTKSGRYLVVGHSNTVPQMLRSLNLTTSFDGNIPDAVYSYLFVVRKKGNHAATLEEKRYGRY